MQAEATKEWLTYREAEEVYSLSRTTLRAMVVDGAIKARNIGRAVRLNRASLDEFMAGEDATEES